MADFRVLSPADRGKYQRFPIEKLSDSDRRLVERYVADFNRDNEEINKKLPNDKKLFPKDPELTIYEIESGVPSDRQKLLTDLRTRYPAPKPDQTSLPSTTLSIPSASELRTQEQTLNSKITTLESQQQQNNQTISRIAEDQNRLRSQRNNLPNNAEERTKINQQLSDLDRQRAGLESDNNRLSKEIVNTDANLQNVERRLSGWVPFGERPESTATSSAPSVVESKQSVPNTFTPEQLKNATPISTESVQSTTSQEVSNQVPASVQPATQNSSPIEGGQVQGLDSTLTAPVYPPKEPPAALAPSQTLYDNSGNPYTTSTTRAPGSDIATVTINKDNSTYTGPPRTNPLNVYANYTYGLSLRALTIADYNAIVDDPKQVRTRSNNNVLIASGGRRSAELQRSVNFNEDFFFDNFKMTSIIGLNARSRGSNVIEMSFTIIEPYGITLINRILKEADRLGIDRWDEMPFLMVIEFFGNTDNGELLALAEHTKYLPIRIIDVKIKLTAQGAEYQVSAVPYNHQAHAETMAVTPINVEVTATSIKDFFDPRNSSDLKSQMAEREKQTRSEQERLGSDVSNLESWSAGTEVESRLRRDSAQRQEEIKKTRYKVGSYAAAINEYYASLKEKKIIEQADTYTFSIDKEISESTITKKENNTVRTSPMATKASEKDKVELDKLINPINAGTNIIEVINQAIRSSSYITNQIDLDKKDKNSNNEPINWFKIVPKVKIGAFDKKRQTYQKDIVYHVSKYTYFNNKYPFTKNTGTPTSWVKEYNYIFTGKNDSIIDLNIDFNTAFYIAIQSFKGKTKEVSGASVGEKTTTDDKNNTTSKTREESPTDTTKQSLDPTPLRVVPRSGNNETGANKDDKTDAANDLFKSVLSSARGDMINIQMKILGDPEFIKQDDLLYMPGQQVQRVIDEFGSLVTDATEIVSFVRFRTPSDIDQSTGLMDFQTWENESSFTGLYRVIQVVSEFVRGQFVQTLDLIRLFQQEDLYKKSSAAKIDSGRDNTENQQQGAEQRANEQAAAEQQSRLAFSRPPYGDATASSATNTAAETTATDSKVSGTGVKTPGPRIRKDETPLAETTPAEHIKSGFELLKSKISEATTSIGEATNKFGRAIFAPDPNAPPYTGDDPFVRARLGLPQVDLGQPSPAVSNLSDTEVNQQIQNIIDRIN